MTESANPLLAAVKTRSATRRATEPPAEAAPAPKFDTTTKAAPASAPRRFQLGDLPKFEAKLFPALQRQFPHLNARMYGGWLRGCISDNACCFICTEEPGTVAMAHMYMKPMSPVPLVEIGFVIGAGDDYFVPLYAHIFKWAQEIGAPEVHFRNTEQIPYMKKAQSPYVESITKTEYTVVSLKKE